LAAVETVTGEGGTCFGDSGGPQLHDGLIVSITTGGDSPCRANGVNFRVDTPAAQAVPRGLRRPRIGLLRTARRCGTNFIGQITRRAS
jgi:hypothetical protein